MDKATQKRLFEEIKGYFASGSTKLAEQEMYYPASVYYEPATLDREKRLFKKFPIVAGHVDELRNPGDFIAHDLFGEPIVIARQKDGSLAAFRNVCSHRGARVCAERRGNASQFLCPYHAWTYNLDGSLRGAPKAAFPGLDKAQAHLPSLQVAERHGLVWVLIDSATEIDLPAYLGELDYEIGSYGIAECKLHRSEVFEAGINWKSVLDGFLEVYHFATLHAGSIAPYFYGNHSPFHSFGSNGRMLGVRKSFDTILDKSFEEVDFLPHVAVNYQLFPNTIIIWQGDHFESWTAFPGKNPANCRVLVQMMIPAAIYTEETRHRWDRNWRIMMDTVIEEDWAISQVVQAALPSIANNEVIFGANEPGLQHLHGSLARELQTIN